jgi:hypothetical protein
MGFLDKLKHAAEGSGVHARIEAPYEVSASQGSVPVTLTFEAKKAPVVLDGYQLTVERQEQSQDSDEMDPGMGDTERDGPTYVVAQGNELIQLQPGSPVSFEVEVPLDNFAAEMRDHFGRFGGVLGDMAQADERVDYHLHVRAAVQGTKHHAHASSDIRLRTLGMTF